MFEILFPLLMGWLVITLAGHATWVVVAKFFNLFTDDVESEVQLPKSRNAVAKSVIRELRAKGRIDTSTMKQLLSAINEEDSRKHLNPEKQPQDYCMPQ